VCMCVYPYTDAHTLAHVRAFSRGMQRDATRRTNCSILSIPRFPPPSLPSRFFLFLCFSAVVNSELIKCAFDLRQIIRPKFTSRIDGSLTSGDGENCVGNSGALKNIKIRNRYSRSAPCPLPRALGKKKEKKPEKKNRGERRRGGAGARGREKKVERNARISAAFLRFFARQRGIVREDVSRASRDHRARAEALPLPPIPPPFAARPADRARDRRCHGKRFALAS